jgi:hypothetical protein
MGQELRFHLSHALFSSYDIDAGTRLLLKTLAARVDMRALRSCLDVGCGVGVIGACVKICAPQARVLMQDRDALAAEFTRANCSLNRLPDAAAECSLGFRGLDGERFDLVTSNLPAKAGEPVLKWMFLRAAAALSQGGTAAIVIVAPLAELARETVADLGCPIVHSESTREHAVLHFKPPAGGLTGEGDPDDLAPYIRGRASFSSGQARWDMEAGWSLPDFDTLGRSLELALEEAGAARVAGSVLVWNPGQGHLPAFLARRFGGTLSGLSLASRDALELAVSERNMRALGRPASAGVAVSSESALAASFPSRSFDALFASPHPVPRAPWQPHLLDAARALLRPGGLLLAHGTSTEIHRFLAGSRGFRLRTDTRRLGVRAALLARG